MNVKISIINSLYISFGVFIIAILTGGTIMFSDLHRKNQILDDINRLHYPAVKNITDLSTTLLEAKINVENLVYSQIKQSNKTKLQNVIIEKIPFIVAKINKEKRNWKQHNITAFDDLRKEIIDTLVVKYTDILSNISEEKESDENFHINKIKTDEAVSYANQVQINLKNLTTDIEKQIYQKEAEISKIISRIRQIIVIVIVSLLLFTVLVIIVIRRSIYNPIMLMRNFLIKMNQGTLPDEFLKITNNEFGEMAKSINALNEGLKRTAHFALEIGRGNFTADFFVLSENDILGKSLITMRDNLKQANAEEQRRKREDEIRSWTTHGLAKFGDILRKNVSIEKLSYEIMDNLLEYLDSIQGALYLVEDSDPNDVHFQMKAAVAYGRHKLANTRIELEEGLLGRCYFERDIVYLQEIPEEYVRITSGLGDANPTVLLLLPLIVNNQIFGIIEIARFDKLETFQIDFLKKVSNDIAGTIATSRINEKTARLLAESQQKGLELFDHEEKMRKNMEELRITQEESQRKENELLSVIEATNSSIGRMELDMTGKITSINDIISKILNIKASETIGRDLKNLIILQPKQEQKYKEMWDGFSNGIPAKIDLCYLSAFGDIWLRETFTPLKNAYDVYDKVLAIAVDVTETITKDKAIRAYKREIDDQGNMLFQAVQQINNLKEQIKTREIEQNKELEQMEENHRSQIDNMQTQIDELEDRLKTLLGTSDI